MLGTKTPSIISICNHSASLLLIISRSDCRFAKFADNNDGDTIKLIIRVVLNLYYKSKDTHFSHISSYNGTMPYHIFTT